MRYILWLFSVFFIGGFSFLFFNIIKQNFVFDGYFTAHYTFENESPFISLLKPRGRVDQEIEQDEQGDFYQRLLIDPVYIDISTPRSFTKARVHIKYKNPYEQLFELGLSGGENSNQFTFSPIENKIIDKLSKSNTWHILEENGLVLFQKENLYSSIADFTRSVPADKVIAKYNFDLNYIYKKQDYKSAAIRTELHKSLRGAHSFYTYVGDGEDLDFQFNMQDVNRLEGEDSVNIKVEYLGREVSSLDIKDDGIEDDSAFMGRPFLTDLIVKKPPEGVYKIMISTSDDIFIRDINTRQQYITFIDHIYLADNVGYWNEHFPQRYTSTTLLSNVEKLRAITAHEEGYQDISFGESSVFVDQKHIMYTAHNPLAQRDSYIDTVTIPQNDIKILGKGLFALNQETFFNPLPFEITGDPQIDLDKYNIDFLIAGYTMPIQAGDWFTQSIDYDLTSVSDGDTKYRLAFSFPYSQRDETDIRISDIYIEYWGDKISFTTFFDKIYTQIKKIINI